MTNLHQVVVLATALGTNSSGLVQLNGGNIIREHYVSRTTLIGFIDGTNRVPIYMFTIQTDTFFTTNKLAR